MPANLRLAAFVILLPVAATTQTVSSEELILSADRPVIAVQTRRAGRNFMQLPAVDFQFDVRPVCRAGMLPKSLSLNIADTRGVLAEDRFDGDSPISISVRIPASQIAPIALDGFCAVQDAPQPEPSQLLNIAGVLSVQASLRCESIDASSVVYAARALDVALRCGTGNASAETEQVESVGTR